MPKDSSLPFGMTCLADARHRQKNRQLLLSCHFDRREKSFHAERFLTSVRNDMSCQQRDIAKKIATYSTSIWPETLALTCDSPASTGIGAASMAIVLAARNIGWTIRPEVLTDSCLMR